MSRDMDDLRNPEWSVPGSEGMSDLKALNEAFDAHFTSDKKNRDAAIAAWNAVYDGALVDRAEYERANAVSAEMLVAVYAKCTALVKASGSYIIELLGTQFDASAEARRRLDMASKKYHAALADLEASDD